MILDRTLRYWSSNINHWETIDVKCFHPMGLGLVTPVSTSTECTELISLLSPPLFTSPGSFDISDFMLAGLKWFAIKGGVGSFLIIFPGVLCFPLLWMELLAFDKRWWSPFLCFKNFLDLNFPREVPIKSSTSLKARNEFSLCFYDNCSLKCLGWFQLFQWDWFEKTSFLLLF